jgi:hypothetical protein
MPLRLQTIKASPQLRENYWHHAMCRTRGESAGFANNM